MPQAAEETRPRLPVLHRGASVSLPPIPYSPSIPYILTNRHPDGCIHNDCKDPRAPRLPNTTNTSTSPSPYCASHRCADPACDQRREEPGPGCRKHTCHDPRCTSLVAGADDPRDERNYCPAHQICQAQGCRNPVFVHPDNPSGRYCFAHFCHGCNGVCRLHAEHGCAVDHPLYRGCYGPCWEVGCRAPKAVKSEDPPKPKCKFPACTRNAEDGSDVCSLHTCQFDGCKAPLSSAPVPAPASLVCAVHQCSESGCPNPRVSMSNNVSSITASGAPLAFLSLYCLVHTCRAKDCVYKPVRDGAAFCGVHKCRERECDREAGDGGVCEEHSGDDGDGAECGKGCGPYCERRCGGGGRGYCRCGRW
ncbi:hypothetical protein F5B20DRAFT_325602 [Whalleya microplaca]|nr:hypothetical protein F5B20DRAFT_325602 [Whalleya microplaca]